MMTGTSDRDRRSRRRSSPFSLPEAQIEDDEVEAPVVQELPHLPASRSDGYMQVVLEQVIGHHPLHVRVIIHDQDMDGTCCRHSILSFRDWLRRSCPGASHHCRTMAILTRSRMLPRMLPLGWVLMACAMLPAVASAQLSAASDEPITPIPPPPSIADAQRVRLGVGLLNTSTVFSS
jgi:hypothetical protein